MMVCVGRWWCVVVGTGISTVRFVDGGKTVVRIKRRAPHPSRVRSPPSPQWEGFLVSLRWKRREQAPALRRLCVIHNARFEPALVIRSKLPSAAKDIARICCFVVGTGVPTVRFVIKLTFVGEDIILPFRWRTNQLNGGTPSVIFLRKCHLPGGGRQKLVSV